MTWLGRGDGMEAGLVAERGLPLLAIDAAPMVGVGFVGRLRGALRLGRGVARSWWLAGRERPDVLLVTGGYVSVPAAVAAWLRRVPLAIYLPDLRPGRAVSLLARLADRIFVTDEVVRDYLNVTAERVEVTGYPVRAALRDTDRAAARARLGLPADAEVIVVFGGSQGARRLNDALIEAAPTLLRHCWILHVTGRSDAARVSQARSVLEESPEAHRWRVYDYLDTPDMAAALHAADVAVCRAGASTLGELPAAGLAAVLVPLPISLGHQDANADLLAEAGAARVVRDTDWDGPRMLSELDSLLRDAPRLATMRAASAALDRPGAARAIAAGLRSLADGDDRRGPLRGLGEGGR